MKHPHVYWFLLPALVFVCACNVIPMLERLTVSATTEPEYGTYTVRTGDTLARIATQYHLTVAQLVALNVDRYPTLEREPSQLRVGWQLRVPIEQTTSGLTPAVDSGQIDLTQAANLTFDGINAARVQQGLVALRSDVVLKRIAADRSTDMITRDYFSHYDPQTGQEAFTRLLQTSKLTYQYAGENIAEIKNDAGWVPALLTVAVRYTPADVASQFVTGWLNSPEHRANIMNPRYRRTGVALAVSRDGRRIVATQVFSD